jgi:hypothetical protein
MRTLKKNTHIRATSKFVHRPQKFSSTTHRLIKYMHESSNMTRTFHICNNRSRLSNHKHTDFATVRRQCTARSKLPQQSSAIKCPEACTVGAKIKLLRFEMYTFTQSSKHTTSQAQKTWHLHIHLHCDMQITCEREA